MINGLYDYYAGRKKLGSMNDYNEEKLEKQQEYYTRQMNNATSLFNRLYYRDYVNTPQAQNMLKHVRKQLDEQSKALRNTSVVMGYTPEAMIAKQKSNNQLLDNVVSTLSAADAQQKEKAMYNYENMRNRMEDFLHAANMENMLNEFNVQQELQKWNYEAAKPYVQKFAGHVKELLNDRNRS